MHLKHRLQTSQNKVLRLIFDLLMRTHLKSFERFGWLAVEDWYFSYSCVRYIGLFMGMWPNISEIILIK